MNFRLLLLFISVNLLVSGIDLRAEDTTKIQTFTFNDITKRRGVFQFPDGSDKYRRILMRYNLKCDPRTTQDGYDCGEWDYLTYTYVYGHDGVLDSTRRTNPYFRVNNAAPDSFRYNITPIFNTYRETQYSIRHTATTSVNRDTIGAGTMSLSSVLNTSDKLGRSQFVWKASELSAQGMSAGSITGIQLNVDQVGSDINNLEIKLGHTSDSALTDGFVNSGLTKVFKNTVQFSATGYADIQFPTSFNWNGSDNLVIEFSFDNGKTGTNNTVQGSSASFDAGYAASGSNSYLEFRGNQNWVNLGKEPVITGTGSRTIEMWAKINQFTNAGLFQAGTSGSGQDFTLRTTRTTDRFRAQLWGSGKDFDFTFSGAQGEWHHYAMTYDGSTCRVFIDGQLVASNTTVINTPLVDFRLGRWQGNYLQGDIDEVRIWDKALSGSDITDWMHKTVDNSHPSYSNLIGYYDLNEGAGLVVNDKSAKGNAQGKLSGIPWWGSTDQYGLGFDGKVVKERPNVIFEQGVYTSIVDSAYVFDTVSHRPVNLLIYGNPANGVQIPDNDPNHPSKVTESKVVWGAETYSYLYDKATGNQLGQTWIKGDSVVHNKTLMWYSPEYRIEIGRYITPYGINLDLGPEGFVWWFDVTDYVHYLRDSVDISAGNQQELIDLQFLFIKGQPDREVIQVDRVWGQSGSKSYRNLDNDVSLKEVAIPKASGAENFKVKTRFTGHGHNSNDGSYPHCCEWKDNEHTLLIDGKKFTDWHIWQPTQCAENPVWPQGGTWTGAREGWCPGDVVYENQFEITGREGSGSSIKIDYDIEDVPTNNQGMGNGNYVVAVHLIQYGPIVNKWDAELVDIYAPAQYGVHQRKGFTCGNPMVVLKNSGSEALTRADIRYSVDGGDVKEFKWTGRLFYGQTEVIELPVNESGFYTGKTRKVTAKVANPNGKGDQNPNNSIAHTTYDLPDNYPAKVIVRFKANNRPSDNYWYITNVKGDTLIMKDQFTPNVTYQDTLDYAQGCYNFYMHDEANDGLNYWASTAQGAGSLHFFIYNTDGTLNTVKQFNPNFGRTVKHSFTIDKELGSYVVQNPSGLKWEDNWEKWPESVSEIDQTVALSVYPNPTSTNLNVELVGAQGTYSMKMYSTEGKVVYESDLSGQGLATKQIDVSNMESGMYLLIVRSDAGVQVQRVVVR